jgi:ABC-type sugar transport system permease subunit
MAEAITLPTARPASRIGLFFRKYSTAYLFIAVPVIWNLVFLFIPMVFSLWWSFTDYNGLKTPNFIGLKNYIWLFTKDRAFLASLGNTSLFVLIGMGIGPTLGLLTAIMLNQKVRFQSLFRAAYFMPVMTSMVVVSTIWIMLYNRNGIINNIITGLGGSPVSFLSNPHWALVSVALASIWQGFGFETVVFLAALQSIPKELYEAATIDGAGAGQRFFNITIPSLRPVILFVYIYGIIGSYQVFDQIYVMTSGGPADHTRSMVYHLFMKFRDLQLGEASAVAYILFAILVVFSFIQWHYFTEKE